MAISGAVWGGHQGYQQQDGLGVGGQGGGWASGTGGSLERLGVSLKKTRRPSMKNVLKVTFVISHALENLKVAPPGHPLGE